MSATSPAIRNAPRTLYSWLRIEWDDYKWLVLIIGLALAIRVIYVLAIQTEPPFGEDPYQYDRLALSILNGDGYVDANGRPGCVLARRIPCLPGCGLLRYRALLSRRWSRQCLAWSDNRSPDIRTSAPGPVVAHVSRGCGSGRVSPRSYHCLHA